MRISVNSKAYLTQPPPPANLSDYRLSAKVISHYDIKSKGKGDMAEGEGEEEEDGDKPIKVHSWISFYHFSIV